MRREKRIEIKRVSEEVRLLCNEWSIQSGSAVLGVDCAVMAEALTASG